MSAGFSSLIQIKIFFSMTKGPFLKENSSEMKYGSLEVKI
jgi:hypothetical protein